jgi:hypothetical protein
METFVSGELKIEIVPDGMNPEGRERFKGAIILPDGTRWEFDDLCSGVGGTRHGEIEMAESAISFGSYYSKGNRGEAPEWAPSEEVATEIGNKMCYLPTEDERPINFPNPGETDEEGEVYAGDSIVVFASKEVQDKWIARYNAKFHEREAERLTKEIHDREAKGEEILSPVYGNSPWGKVAEHRRKENEERIKGKLLPRCESFAWPGGYPLIYVDDGSNVLCADCATEEQDRTGEKLNVDVHYEGEAEICSDCNEEIESAYGTPEDKE